MESMTRHEIWILMESAGRMLLRREGGRGGVQKARPDSLHLSQGFGGLQPPKCVALIALEEGDGSDGQESTRQRHHVRESLLYCRPAPAVVIRGCQANGTVNCSRKAELVFHTDLNARLLKA
jgi:hypothetical protein